MKITILGFSHLGFIASACCARHFDVTVLDSHDAVIDRLAIVQQPQLEPSLEDRIADGLENRRLRYTSNTILGCLGADVLWVAWDPPVHHEGTVIDQLRPILPNLAPGTVVLLSSPVPVRTCAELHRSFPQFHFAFSACKLPRGRAVEAFEKADRVVVGVLNDSKKEALERLFDPFTDRVEFMRAEVAEMLAQLPEGLGSAAAPNESAQRQAL